jgi:FixJ family two-component response regulator
MDEKYKKTRRGKGGASKDSSSGSRHGAGSFAFEADELFRGFFLTSPEAGEAFHIVITDIAMPGVDGIELIDSMKERNIHLPSMVISGFLDAGYREVLETRGISHILEKPFTPRLLIEITKDILRNEGISDCDNASN